MRALGLANTPSPFFDIPRIVYGCVWWLIFILIIVLPTYDTEAFFVFPATLAFVIAWLLGVSSYVFALISSNLSVLKLSPQGWIALVEELRNAGIHIPPSSTSDAAARQAAQVLERPLPDLILDTVLRWTSLIALEAIIGAIISLVGLLVGPLLASVHVWIGWSPVSILYAACIPVSISLSLYTIVPIIAARSLVGARLRAASLPPGRAATRSATAEWEGECE
jgi:hypothetical protein